MSPRPVIGIAAQFQVALSATWPSFPRSYLWLCYAASVERAGGTPLVLPTTTDAEVLAHQADLVDGLLLVGGEDVDPARWGAAQSRHSGDPVPERDAHEWALLSLAEERGTPVLGICRGMQVLNVFHGGTLVQDLAAAGVDTKHAAVSAPAHPVHAVGLEPASALGGALGESVRVNSFHHQAVEQVAPGWRVVGRAPDGVIEAIERDGDVPGLGVQWHPEHMAHVDDAAQAVFDLFVARSARR